jgi:iron complex transport system ATP-binding protein
MVGKNMSEIQNGIVTELLTWQVKSEGRVILDNVSINISRGHFYGIIGQNGSGKTSLLRHLLKLLPVTQGKVTLDSVSLNCINNRQAALKMSLVPQNTVIESDYTGADIVAMGRTPHKKRFEPENENDRKIIDDSMKKANCYSYRNENISSLSGGESQRVIIARAIAQQAGYMFLDEPIAHLDIKNQVELMETLKRLNKDENVTVIAVLHDLNLAAQYCDRLIMMKDGKVYAQGETSKICNGSNLKNVYGISFEEVRRADGSIVYMPESADV